jgi:urease gamma subunit
MYLSPTEEDRLRIFVAAELARHTRAVSLDGRMLAAPPVGTVPMSRRYLLA